jgi:hypothetical protein
VTDPTEPIERDQAYYEQRAARAVQVARQTLALDPGMAALAGFDVRPFGAFVQLACRACAWDYILRPASEPYPSLLDLIGHAAAHVADPAAHNEPAPIRTPDEIRDVPASERTPEELYRYGTHGPLTGLTEPPACPVCGGCCLLHYGRHSAEVFVCDDHDGVRGG